jgi:hypothetical protein
MSITPAPTRLRRLVVPVDVLRDVSRSTSTFAEALSPDPAPAAAPDPDALGARPQVSQ